MCDTARRRDTVDRLSAFIQDLPADALADQPPDGELRQWGLKEVLAHLVYHHELYVRLVEATLVGTPAQPPTGAFRELNAQAVAANAGAPAPALVARLQEANWRLERLYLAHDPNAIVVEIKAGAKPRTSAALVPEVEAHIPLTGIFDRNPMTLGAIVLYLGVSVAAGSPGAALLVVLGVVALLTYIRLAEEKERVARFGEEYLAYRRRVQFMNLFRVGRHAGGLYVLPIFWLIYGRLLGTNSFVFADTPVPLSLDVLWTRTGFSELLAYTLGYEASHGWAVWA